jgi:tryptophanyl-tRNA synthetase
MSKKIILSGVKPTGRPHIGNYFGAMKQMVDLQNQFADAEKFFMIADYHALNLIQSKEEMAQFTLDLALDYLAIGIDPKQSTLFKQSDVSAHTELAWIFNTITTMPYLMRAHAFKDAEAKNKEINVGTFDYPILMAADILLYDTTLVPVGQDQKQHVEYSRDIAQKFNNVFNTETFNLPEPLIMKGVEIVSGTNGQKMSKSYNNTIPLFATREEITKAVMGIVTDSSGDVPVNVYNIHKLIKSETELKEIYDKNKGKYKILKETLIEDLDTMIKPLRKRRAELEKNTEEIKAILADGAIKAKTKANAKLLTIKKNIGVL